MILQYRHRALILSFFSSLVLTLLAAGTFTMGATPASAVQGKQKLEKRYKEWMEHDVVYIITKDEREAFLKLTSDEARDKFIQDFWEVRNPNPGSPSNSYKEEFYQRIAFTDSRFGIGSGTDGWRTDRGRTYITLGAPQQKQVYRAAANLRGIEVWFYANVHPSLPSAFYVMFYEKSGTGDYRFYSPYFDGPDKLTTGVEAQNSRLNALHMIRDSLGGEMERYSLSLIPGEPVDFQTGKSSLESDTMLSILKGLADQPANRDDINHRWMMRERVTSSIIMEGRNLEIITLPVRDARGLTRLDYAVRLRNPSDLSLTTASDGRYTYSVEVQVRVFGEQNKTVFVQQKPVTETFDKRRYTEIKDKAFSYEGMLPLPPGKYRLVFQFTDWSKGASYRTEREVTIPAIEADKFVVPGVLPFLTAEPVDSSTAEVTPFALAGVKFTPLPTTGLTLSPDMNLQVAYQIWGPARDPRSLKGQSLHLEYALGMPSAPGSGKIIQDDADMAQFDADGTLVNGKKLELLEKQPGNYILTVAVNDPNSTMRGFSKLNFKLADGASINPPWDVVETSIRADSESGVLDQQRGLCYLSQGLLDEGRGWLRRALNTNHANEPARAHLVEAYYAKNDFAAVVSLYKDTGLTDTADSETYLRIANSLQKTGNLPGAISLLEAGLQAHPQDVALYLGLADFYKLSGNTQKAEELIRKGKSFAPTS